MTDVFLSYSSADRDRVAPLHAALADSGFDVFWDQTVPAGSDWDTWIRGKLTASRCAVVVWSSTSVKSKNVRHEATVAAQTGKLIGILIDPLAAAELPMGLYNQQAANFTGWSDDTAHPEWLKLCAEIESKLAPFAPLWAQRHLHALEADREVVGARLKTSESKVRQLQEKIATDSRVALDALRERDAADERAKALLARLAEKEKALEALRQSQAALQNQLKAALAQAAVLGAPNHTTQRASTRGVVKSRGHVSVFDVAIGIATATGLVAFAVMVDNGKTTLNRHEVSAMLGVASAVVAAWSAILALRLWLRRRTRVASIGE
jgi:TIR domain